MYDIKRKIDAFFSLANRSGFCNNFTFDTLLSAADHTLYKSICNSQLCINSILPPVKLIQYDLRVRGHEQTLLEHTTALHRKSFILRHLFEIV